jgi:hypothetical protein
MAAAPVARRLTGPCVVDKKASAPAKRAPFTAHDFRLRE